MTSDLRPYPAYKDTGLPWLGKVPRVWECLPHRALFTEVKEQEHVGEPLLSVTISRGIIRQSNLLANSSKKGSSNLDKPKYKLVKSNDIAYNKMRAWQGAVGASRCGSGGSNRGGRPWLRSCARAGVTARPPVSKRPRSSTTPRSGSAKSSSIRARARWTRWCRRRGRAGRSAGSAVFDSVIVVTDRRKIGGQARAMIACGSINRAIQYYEAVSAYLTERKRSYRAIVAFSDFADYYRTTMLSKETDPNNCTT